MMVLAPGITDTYWFYVRNLGSLLLQINNTTTGCLCANTWSGKNMILHKNQVFLFFFCSPSNQAQNMIPSEDEGQQTRPYDLQALPVAWRGAACRWVAPRATLCCCWSRACFACYRYCAPRCCSPRPAGISGSAVCQLSHLDVEQEREWRGREEGKHRCKWQRGRRRQAHGNHLGKSYNLPSCKKNHRSCRLIFKNMSHLIFDHLLRLSPLGINLITLEAKSRVPSSLGLIPML